MRSSVLLLGAVGTATALSICSALGVGMLGAAVFVWWFDKRLLAYDRWVSDEVLAASVVLLTGCSVLTFDGTGLLGLFFGRDLRGGRIRTERVAAGGDSNLSIRYCSSTDPDPVRTRVVPHRPARGVP